MSKPLFITSYIGIGSNLDTPLTHVNKATDALRQIHNTRLVKLSSWYKSKPVGPQAQADFINGVAQLETLLDPFSLLSALHNIENAHGRVRTEHWGPRTLDLDLLLYNQLTLHTPELVIPHPHMHTRHFVLAPLLEIAPTLAMPNKALIHDIIIHCTDQKIQKLSTDSAHQHRQGA